MMRLDSWGLCDLRYQYLPKLAAFYLIVKLNSVLERPKLSEL